MSAKLLTSVAAGYEENNLRSARQILAEPEDFGGEGSGLVNWAHRVVERNQRETSASAVKHASVPADGSQDAGRENRSAGGRL